MRRCLEEDHDSLSQIFNGNFLVKAFYEVTNGDTGCCQKDSGLTKSRALLQHVAEVSRSGLKQLFQANANQLATGSGCLHTCAPTSDC